MNQLSHGGRKWVALVVAAAVTITVSACGESSSGDTGTSATSGTGGSVAGKTIGWIDVTLDGSYQQRIHDTAQAAVDHLGWDMKTIDIKGDPALAATGISTLLDSHVDAILTSGVTPSTMRAGLVKAKAAGIPVILVSSEVDSSLNDELGLTYYGEDESDLFVPLADHLVEQFKPGDQVGLLSTTFLVSGPMRATTLKDALDKAGVDVVGDLETGFDFASAQSNAASLITKFPDLKAIIPVYDIWAAATVAAVKQAGKTGDIAVYTSPADDITAPLMNTGEIQGAADGNMIISPLIAIDQLLKHFDTGDPVDPAAGDGKFTYELITPENVPPAGQNGPISIDDATAPYFEAWDAAYEQK